MTRLRVAIILIFAVLASLSAGFWLGVRQGWLLGELAGAPLRGTFATRVLTELKNGDTRSAQLIFEMEVTRGLVAADELIESPSRRFLGSISNVHADGADLHDDAVRLANYRKVNPSPFRGGSFTHVPGESPEERALIDEPIEQRRSIDRMIDVLVERYASQ